MACSCLSWTVPQARALNRRNAIGIYLRWQAAEAGRLGSAVLRRCWIRSNTGSDAVDQVLTTRIRNGV
jgi:hypothetical protein